MHNKYTLGWPQIVCLVAAVVFLVCFCAYGYSTEQKSGVVSVTVNNNNEATDRFETVEEWTEKLGPFTSSRCAIVKDTSTDMLYYACYFGNGNCTFTPYYADEDSVMDYDKYIKWYKDK